MIADVSSSHDKDENLKLTPLQRREIIQKRKVHELVTLDKQEFKNDSELLAQLVELATPSYQDAHFVVAAALQRATTLYLGYGVDGQLISFNMAAIEWITFYGGQKEPTLYLGLCGTQHDVKSSGIVRLMLGRVLLDGAQWEWVTGHSLILWGMTASPIIYALAHMCDPKMEPSPDGSYSVEQARYAQGLRQRLGYAPTTQDENPFILKRFMAGSSYSSQEVARIKQAREHKRFVPLEDWGIDETQGDRLLFIGAIPPTMPAGFSLDG